MGSMDGYLQALSLVAILILAPMTIHLIVHKEENTVFVYVETETEDEEEDELGGREIPQLIRSEVARIATFNIKVFGKTKMEVLGIAFLGILVVYVFSPLLIAIISLIRYYLLDQISLLPKSVIIIEYLGTLFFLLSYRFAIKMYYLSQLKSKGNENNVLIFGAGKMGLITKNTLE